MSFNLKQDDGPDMRVFGQLKVKYSYRKGILVGGSDRLHTFRITIRRYYDTFQNMHVLHLHAHRHFREILSDSRLYRLFETLRTHHCASIEVCRAVFPDVEENAKGITIVKRVWKCSECAVYVGTPRCEIDPNEPACNHFTLER